jgi:hypothetical protein
MRFVCDAAGGKAWFRIETEAEAMRESELMRHAVEKHFRRAQEQAAQSYRPAPGPCVEQDIGREAHVRRTMPVFLTLRDAEGTALAAAMLPPQRHQAAGRDDAAVCPMVVGPGNGDPYPEHGEAIRDIGRHFGLSLDRIRCYPYGRL